MSTERGRDLLRRLLAFHAGTYGTDCRDDISQARAVIASDADEQRAEIVTMLLAESAWWRRDGSESIANVLNVAAEMVRAGREREFRGRATR